MRARLRRTLSRWRNPPRQRCGSKTVALRDVRAFRYQEISLAPGVTVLIGRNGTNKTTLLRCIAVNLAGPEDGQALLSFPTGGFVSAGEDKADIVLGTTAGRRRTQIQRWDGGERLGRSTNPGDSGSVFVCGYGAGRGVVGTDSGRGYRPLDAVTSLFDYSRPLVDPELTLRRLRDHLGSERYQRTIAGIGRVLGLGPDDTIELPRGGGVSITGPAIGGSIPLTAWADGYRLTFTWLLDLYGWALQADRIDDDGYVDGVVLIDEIDQHLHPALQAGVVAQLSDLLPTTQFVVTTHSPLVAIGAKPEQLVVLHRVDDHVEVLPRVPDYRTWSVEDLLTDARLFATAAHAPEMMKQLESYQELVAKGPDARDDAEDSELRRLAKEVQGVELPPVIESRKDEADATFRRLMAES